MSEPLPREEPGAGPVPGSFPSASSCQRIVMRLDVPDEMRGSLGEMVHGCPITGAGRVHVAIAGAIGVVFGIVVGLVAGIILVPIAFVLLPGQPMGASMILLSLLVLGALAGGIWVARQQLDDARAVSVERRLVARRCLRCGAGVMGVPVDANTSHVLVRCPECGRETIRVVGPPGERLRRATTAPP